MKSENESAINLWIIRPAKDVIDAYAIEVGKNHQRIRGRNAFPGFIFGNQRLFDACFHLQTDLGQAALLAEFTQVGFRLSSPTAIFACIGLTNMTYCLIIL